VGLNILDMGLTQIILNLGGSELNRIMQYSLSQSLGLAWCIKLISVIAVTLVFLWCATMHPRPIKIAFIGLIVFMSIVCLYNGIVLVKFLYH